LEIPAPEKEEEAAAAVAEVLEIEEAEKAEETEERNQREEEAKGAEEELKRKGPAIWNHPFWKYLLLKKKRKRTVTIAEGLETEEVEESEEVEEETKVKEEERYVPPELLPLEIPALEKEEEATAEVAEGLEIEEIGEAEETEEEEKVEEETKGEEEERGVLAEPSPLEIPTTEKEEAAVEVDDIFEIAGAGEKRKEMEEEAKEAETERERAVLAEPSRLEIPAPEKEEGTAAGVAGGLEEKKEEEKRVPKVFLSPTIAITTVKGFTKNGELSDIVVGGNSSGGKRILIKIQIGNVKYYKIVNPSSSGEFKSSFEQDISRNPQSENGDQITVDALYLANSAIYDTWQGNLPLIEKDGEI